MFSAPSEYIYYYNIVYISCIIYILLSCLMYVTMYYYMYNIHYLKDTFLGETY